MPLAIVWKGVLLGLGAAAPIGPVNVEIARRSLRGGFTAGFILGCGAVTADVVYAILASLSVRPFLDRPRIILAFGIVAAAVLTILGLSSLRSAARRLRAPSPAGGAARPGQGYLTGILMTGLNPMTLAFWFVAVPGTVGRLSENAARDLPFLCAGVALGTLSWVCFFAGLMSFMGRRGGRRMLFAADFAGGTMLLGFAGYVIWRVAGGLL